MCFFFADALRARTHWGAKRLNMGSHFAIKADLSSLEVATSKNIRRRRNSRTHHKACIPLRLDDIQCLRIDDMPQRVADDIHAFGVIGMREYENLLNYLPKYDIIQKR